MTYDGWRGAPEEKGRKGPWVRRRLGGPPLGSTERPRRRQGESWLYCRNKHTPSKLPSISRKEKANRRPTSGCAVTSEAGLGPVTIWAGGQPQVRQEGVALAQRLQLLALTQRSPCTVLGTQRGLGCCQAGTHTHIHTERDTPLEGVGVADCGPRPKADMLRGSVDQFQP